MELRKCLFCGKEITFCGAAADFHFNNVMRKWVLMHSCLYDMNYQNGVSITISSPDRQEVVDKWNGVYEIKESESL